MCTRTTWVITDSGKETDLTCQGFEFLHVNEAVQEGPVAFTNAQCVRSDGKRVVDTFSSACFSAFFYIHH